METKTVLLAGDDLKLLRVLSLRCRELGLEVRSTAEGLQALAVIRKYHPNLVIFDIKMPVATGSAVCEILASDEQLSAIPVILLVGGTDPKTVDRYKALGVRYVCKSLDTWTTLRKVICELLDLPSDIDSTEVRPERKKQNAKVLVVDDDSGLCKAISIRLGAYGIEVFQALTGTDGFHAALKESPM